jgi:Family of unknown function (DUF5996)
MTDPSADQQSWPELPLGAWRDTCVTLQLRTQIVGKIRLSLTPWLNHSWQVPLYLTARGMTTTPIYDGERALEISFDFIDHVLRVDVSDARRLTIPLRAQPVADFFAGVTDALAQAGVRLAIDEMPNEMPDPIRFSEDRVHAAYDAEYVQRFWRVLLQCDRVFKLFRTGFIGKASPVHFFWGSFDLAVTRFSGRRAPLHPGGVPHLADVVTREAYSHEVSSAGFWPGGGAIDYPAFYSYAYPTPEGFGKSRVRPAAAFFSQDLGEFLLPYDAVRTAADPTAVLLEFLLSTYEAAANLAHWDRASLECPLGRPGVARPLL